LSDFSKEFYHWLAVCHNEAQRIWLWLRCGFTVLFGVF